MQLSQSIQTISMAEAIVPHRLTRIRTHIHGYRVHYVRAVNNPLFVVDRHRPILQAIIDQNPDQGRPLARAHARNSKSKLQAYVEAQQKATRPLTTG